MNKKFIIYSVGILTGVGLSFLYFQSSTFDKSSHYQKQLMEKSKEVESVTQKLTEIVHQNDILTEENSELSVNVSNIEFQLNEYKSKEKKEEEEKLNDYLKSKEKYIKKMITEYINFLKLTKEQQYKFVELVREV